MRHLLAASEFLAPQIRQTFRKSRRFCAICFFVTSVIGNGGTFSCKPSHEVVNDSFTIAGISMGVLATFTPAARNAEILDSAVPKLP